MKFTEEQIMNFDILLIILVMTIATFPSRFIPAYLIKNITIGKKFHEALRIMPFCILIAMISISVIDKEVVDYEKIGAIVLIFIFSWVFINVGLSVVLGVLLYTVMNLP